MLKRSESDILRQHREDQQRLERAKGTKPHMIGTIAGSLRIGPAQFNIARPTYARTISHELLRGCAHVQENVDLDEISLSGVAAPSERISNVLDDGYRILFKRGAFRGTLASGKDCAVLFNFSTGHILGRSRNGTARCWEEPDGLHFEVFAPSTSWAADLVSSVDRGDISGSAIDCLPTISNYETRSDGTRVRVVQEAVLGMVSICSFAEFDLGITVGRQSAAAAESYDRKFLSRVGVQI